MGFSHFSVIGARGELRRSDDAMVTSFDLTNVPTSREITGFGASAERAGI
jgi:hypothetical protein